MGTSRVRTQLYTFDEGSSDQEFRNDTRQVFCCVDDTDDLEGEISTGFVAEAIADAFIELGGRIVLGITRHQLLLSDEIAYTSHNSSMCFMALVPEAALDACKRRAKEVIEDLSVETSDPGLCLAVFPLEDDSALLDQGIGTLISFGKKAKVEVCTKAEAYGIAEQIDWLDLTEHGGTGGGIVGALAGVGLRLEGNDGRLRGKWNLKKLYLTDYKSSSVPIGAFCTYLSDQIIGRVQALDTAGKSVPYDTPMFLEGEAKPIFKGGALTIIVDIKDGYAHPCKKVDLGAIGNDENWNTYCDKFELDTDSEERGGDDTKRCSNCLYRRWTERGFDCVVGNDSKSERKKVPVTR